MRGRGAEDLLLAVVDGLRSFPEAILAVFPEVVVHFHLPRQSLGFVAYKDRKAVAAALKAVCQAVNAASAGAGAVPGAKGCPSMSSAWKSGTSWTPPVLSRR
ncbi:MAG: hypothetical protein DI532_19530 [Azospirillum brasilense]|nr:MAG: hypothetical protein DI532_19530 [Azospirillum brasilense]